jgi:hypothetical protein
VDLFNAVDIERADREIDRFIERRHQETNAKANGEQRHIEDAWAESVRRDREKQSRENVEAWCDFHRHMERLHASLCEEHRAKAEALFGEGAS